MYISWFALLIYGLSVFVISPICCINSVGTEPMRSKVWLCTTRLQPVILVLLSLLCLRFLQSASVLLPLAWMEIVFGIHQVPVDISTLVSCSQKPNEDELHSHLIHTNNSTRGHTYIYTQCSLDYVLIILGLSICLRICSSCVVFDGLVWSDVFVCSLLIAAWAQRIDRLLNNDTSSCLSMSVCCSHSALCMPLTSPC